MCVAHAVTFSNSFEHLLLFRGGNVAHRGKSAKRMFKYDLLIPLALAEMLFLHRFDYVLMNFAHTSRSRTRIELVAFTVCH